MVRLFIAVLGYFLIAICNIELYATPPVIGKPWHPNTREHLFGFVDNKDVAHCFIEDEGFRWRNSFNFTVEDHNIDHNNWWFNKVVRFVPAPVNNFSNIDVGETRIDYTNNASADNIHIHLAEIALNVKNLNKSMVAAAAAITIVIEHVGQFYAFSKALTNKQGIVLIASNGGVQNVQDLTCIPHEAPVIRNNLQGLTPLNLPFPGKDIKYACVEGKILSLLVADNFLLFKTQIKNLLTQSKKQLRDETINCNSIHTIILHINVTMDPCAICTRCMVGLTKYLNDGHIELLKPIEIDGILNANFFIEVTSNGRYLGSNPNTIGSFTGYLSKTRSSHTECGGHDDQENTLINLQPKSSVLFPVLDNSLLILPGGMKSWRFNHSFHPYIVFGQINADKQVIDSPRACATHTGNNLPPVQ